MYSKIERVLFESKLFSTILLSYTMTNHPKNCELIYKNLVTSYFYELYADKKYSEDSMILI